MEINQSEYSKKPVIILCFFMVLTCLHFWFTSRYPELQAKSILSNNAPLSSLGFETLVPVKETAALWEKILWGSVNWAYTNKKGMTFAFLFGAFILSLLPFLKRISAHNRFKNSVLGLLIGAPLGVCVNCAAPIAYSLHLSGISLPATLSALIASPTLNIVVITMMFAIFPFYLVAAKLFLTLFFILVIIPVSCRLFFRKEERGSTELELVIPQDKMPCTGSVPEGALDWFSALYWSAKTYLKNLFYVLRIALPLMVAAGILGSIAVNIMPWSNFSSGQHELTGWSFVAVALGLSFFGVLLPSPIAFDVILASVMLQSGLPIAFVAILLFTLGTYSIYAFFVLWKAVSLRLAAFLYVVTMVLGLALGVVALYLDSHLFVSSEMELGQQTQEAATLVPDENLEKEQSNTARTYSELQQLISPIIFKNVQNEEIPDTLTIEFAEFSQSPATTGGTFTRISGDDLGISQPYKISYITGIPDAIVQSTMAIASGDVHMDGWQDLLILGDENSAPNIALYTNINGQKFIRQSLPIPDELSDIVALALVDINADKWLDILFTATDGTIYKLINDEGEFRHANFAVLTRQESGNPVSLAFADLGGDGDLDIFSGNWGVGPLFLNFSRSRNSLLIFEEGEYTVKEFSSFAGETLTSLFHDFNQDGHTDLYVGNDFVQGVRSDLLFLGTQDGDLKTAPPDVRDKMFGAQSTMSIDTGDINNDGIEEIYIGQIAYIGHYVFDMSKITDKQIRYSEYCLKDRRTEEGLATCQEEYKFKESLSKGAHFISDACDGLTDPDFRKNCLRHLVNFNNNCSYHYKGGIAPAAAITFSDVSPTYEAFCRNIALALNEKREFYNHSASLPKSDNALLADNTSMSNILLMQDPSDNSYKNVAKERKVGYGAWTWNARFADLDNDSWQDLYLVNGHNYPMALPTNLFYHNAGNGYFEDDTNAFGLRDFTPTSAFSLVDFDHDGDIDIVNVPTDSGVRIYQNNTKKRNSIIFKLRDHSAQNIYALGARIKISYKDKNGVEKNQIRTIKGSGGFRSFNPYEAHFGLGDIETINMVKIMWPDGTQETLNFDFKANRQYRVTRNKVLPD